MNEQSNTYRVYDSMGRATDVVYCASNMKQAYALFKADVKNYQRFFNGHLKRTYNGGSKRIIATYGKHPQNPAKLIEPFVGVAKKQAPFLSLFDVTLF